MSRLCVFLLLAFLVATALAAPIGEKDKTDDKPADDQTKAANTETQKPEAQITEQDDKEEDKTEDKAGEQTEEKTEEKSEEKKEEKNEEKVEEKAEANENEDEKDDNAEQSEKKCGRYKQY